MKRFLTILFLALLPGTVPALDLTPVPSFRELEGFKIPILLFSDGGKQYSFQPPNKWTANGGGVVLNLHPAETPDALLQFRVRSYTPLAAEDVEKWCRAQLPKDASDPTLKGEVANIFTLGELPSRTFTYAYVSQARSFTTSVSVVDWNSKERLAILVTARTPDFHAIQDTAMRSMFSWSAR